MVKKWKGCLTHSGGKHLDSAVAENEGVSDKPNLESLHLHHSHTDGRAQEKKTRVNIWLDNANKEESSIDQQQTPWDGVCPVHYPTLTYPPPHSAIKGTQGSKKGMIFRTLESL